jgi:PAS domain S-box-containing protein
MFVYDAEDLKFLEVNDAALKLYGYTREEFLQLDLTDLYNPEDIQTLIGSAQSNDTQGQYTGPFKQKRKDGTNIIVEIAKSTFTYEDRDAHFNIIKSLTDKQEQDKKFQLFKTTFENTDNLIFVTDSTGIINFVNESVQKYLDVDKNTLINSTFLSLLNDDDRRQVNSQIFNTHLKEQKNLSAKLKKADNTYISIELSAIPIFDFNGEVDSINIIGKLGRQEIETIKEVVQEKEVIKEVYVDRGGTSVDGINSSQLSTIFHEILTPLNVILGFLQEVKDSINTPSKEQNEALFYIDQNKVQILETMNTVSDYAAILGDQFDLVPVNISASKLIDDLNDALKSSGTLPKGKELQPGKVSASFNFQSDINKLLNFLTCFIKIIAKISGEDKIYISIHQYDEERFIVSFKDNFSAITEKLLSVLMSAILRNDLSAVREFGLSRFLVLSINKLLQILKGKVELIQKSGKTNEFGFTFPIVFGEKGIEPKKEVSAKGPEVKVIEPSQMEEVSDYSFKLKLDDSVEGKHKHNEKLDLTKLTCLYIEDQVDSQILFKVQLKELQNIKFAVSFEEALPLLSSIKFDFILMDINLQGEYNGLDALKMIRQMPGMEKLPVIAVTAYVLPGDKDKFIAAGFNDFISKPIFREKIIESLEKVFTIPVKS